jgi:hypothetical protein
MMKRSCGKCEFWQYAPVDGDDEECRRFPGECRKNTPTMNGGCEGRWPETLASECCGEFSPLTTLPCA